MSTPEEERSEYEPYRAPAEPDPEPGAGPKEPPASWPVLEERAAPSFPPHPVPPRPPPSSPKRGSGLGVLALVVLGAGAGWWVNAGDDEPERRYVPAYTDQAEWDACLLAERTSVDPNPVLTPEEVCSVSVPLYDGPGSVDPFGEDFGPGDEDSEFP